MLLSMAIWPVYIMSKGEFCLVFSAVVSDLTSGVLEGSVFKRSARTCYSITFQIIVLLQTY